VSVSGVNPRPGYTPGVLMENNSNNRRAQDQWYTTDNRPRFMYLRYLRTATLKRYIQTGLGPCATSILSYEQQLDLYIAVCEEYDRRARRSWWSAIACRLA